MNKNLSINVHLVFVFNLFVAMQCVAQSTPSEFAEMSLQELFEQSIDESPSEDIRKSPWKTVYQFKSAKFEGYLDGSKSLSFDEVLWNGDPEKRTAKNFPILPTVISQQAHIFALGYQFNSNWNGHISLPYIKQKTDHISVISNYDFFIIESEGIGDTTISTSYNWLSSNNNNWRLTFGVSLPTGSIDEKGDTPRAPGDQQLPYTMQLGSGTFDFPVEFSFQNQSFSQFNFSLTANIRTGKNNRNYRLGNNYGLKGRYKIELLPSVEAFVGLAYLYSAKISGSDDVLMINKKFPYPASITNPNLYGGKKLNLRVGLNMQMPYDFRLNVEFGKPIYQSLNGPQPKEQWRSSIYVSKNI